MAKITENEIAAIYAAAIEVSEGTITKEEARTRVNDQFGTSKGSVGLMIGSIECFFDGTTYKRSLSEASVRHILTRIRDDRSDQDFRRALAALDSHINYYETIRKTTRKGLRKIYKEYLGFLPERHRLPLLSEVEERFNEMCSDIQTLDGEELHQRAHAARHGEVSSTTVTTLSFKRNPYVKEFTLRRADGKCEKPNCPNPSPFKRQDGSVFLEVHHIVPLAENGPDTVENTIALCPNCHHEAHFGTDY